jgi:hypothetical protein
MRMSKYPDTFGVQSFEFHNGMGLTDFAQEKIPECRLSPTLSNAHYRLSFPDLGGLSPNGSTA